jgi:putative transposase
MGSGRCLLISARMSAQPAFRSADGSSAADPVRGCDLPRDQSWELSPRALFETVGAARAFVAVLDDAVQRYRWRLHAYVLMPNHFHLALETPQPNLVEGMHWLQSTMATRFNRYREENGHLFQGRYQSILVEDDAALARVVDYIHLNPARARLVASEQVLNYRWSSLHRLTRQPSAKLIADQWRPREVVSEVLEERLRSYGQRLIKLARDEVAQEAAGLRSLSQGWAIGTSGWRRVIAEEYNQLRLNPGLARGEVRELNEAAWAAALTECLAQSGGTSGTLETRPRAMPWKLTIARRLRNEAGAPVAWIASALKLGKPSSLRSYLARQNRSQNQQTAA